MTEDRKKIIELFIKQKETLDMFVSRDAISQEQYYISLNGLIENVFLLGIAHVLLNNTPSSPSVLYSDIHVIIIMYYFCTQGGTRTLTLLLLRTRFLI